VVRDPAPGEADAPIDWSPWYLPDEEDMGEGNEQLQIASVLRSSLEELARERAWTSVYVGADQFFAWLADEPLVRVSPDVYLLDEPPPPPLPASWQTWKPGHPPPRFAVEIVSGDDEHPERWRKDYEDAPGKYAQLGSRELVIFDPEAAAGRAREATRVALQLYRRQADGAFVRVHAGPGPAQSVEVEAWLVVVREGPVARLRLARDAAGSALFPTAAERAEQERARAERERARAERLAERLRAAGIDPDDG
jgi:Uma2 family endonuclease